MKKTPLNKKIDNLPIEVERFIDGAKIYDSSCSEEARVYFIDKGDGFYLKRSAKGALETEAKMTAYFHSKGLGAEVLHYSSNDFDLLLTEKVDGEDCIHESYLSDPKRLSVILAEELRKLHELDYTGCPVMDRTANYVALAERNFLTDNYDKSHFPNSYGYSSAQEAYRILQEGKMELKRDVLTHGDYCLPNVILKKWKLSGFIDLGNGGVGDRHVDIFWGLWSLGYNLKTERYRELFFDAYGRDKLNEEMLKIVAAAEVFG